MIRKVKNPKRNDLVAINSLHCVCFLPWIDLDPIGF